MGKVRYPHVGGCDDDCCALSVNLFDTQGRYESVLDNVCAKNMNNTHRWPMDLTIDISVAVALFYFNKSLIYTNTKVWDEHYSGEEDNTLYFSCIHRNYFLHISQLRKRQGQS